MNMKAMLFAGGGLMLSMVLTTVWISNDMARIKEREAAEQRAECAAMPVPAPAPPSGDAVGTGAPGAAQAGGPANETCAPQQAGSAVDPYAQAPAMQDPAMDPATAQPVTPSQPPAAQPLPAPQHADPSAGSSAVPVA